MYSNNTQLQRKKINIWVAKAINLLSFTNTCFWGRFINNKQICKTQLTRASDNTPQLFISSSKSKSVLKIKFKIIPRCILQGTRYKSMLQILKRRNPQSITLLTQFCYQKFQNLLFLEYYEDFSLLKESNCLQNGRQNNDHKLCNINKI